jgi:hypothetical protein
VTCETLPVSGNNVKETVEKELLSLFTAPRENETPVLKIELTASVNVALDLPISE